MHLFCSFKMQSEQQLLIVLLAGFVYLVTFVCCHSLPSRINTDSNNNSTTINRQSTLPNGLTYVLSSSFRNTNHHHPPTQHHQPNNHRPWKGPPSYDSISYGPAEKICGVRSTQLMMRKLMAESSRQARIIGGTEVFYGEEPWQADIRLFRGDQFEHICGGAIISNHLVVTAAHCVQV